MARKTQISKEMILKTAFIMLVRDGYATINITSLANELGCSTQPIAWHFGNMDGLRAQLLDFCLEFLKDRFTVEGESVVSILDGIAYRYIGLAFDYPNLYKYLYMSEQDGKKMAKIGQNLRMQNHDKIIQMLEQEHDISAEAADKYLLNLQLYVHGIASYAVTKISFPSKDVIMQMIHEVSEALLKQLKE